MKSRVSFPAARRGAAVSASALLAAALAVLPAAEPVLAANSAHAISAKYRISLNGFDVGDFVYKSAVEGNVYTLSSDVQLSFLLGAFKWRGTSRTVGRATASSLSPTGFNFDFTSTLKDGAVRMGFERGSVKSLSIDPPSPPQPGTVPLKEHHLKGVLDPLTAIMALTQGASGDPCSRKVSIFDGRQRFDLKLAFRRKEPLGSHNEMGTVCMIKYVPIAGYKDNADTQSLANNSGIEITFRSVASADLHVPHRVVLPTLAGPAEITAERVDIRVPGQGQLALVD